MRWAAEMNGVLSFPRLSGEESEGEKFRELWFIFRRFLMRLRDGAVNDDVYESPLRNFSPTSDEQTYFGVERNGDSECYEANVL